MQPSRPSSIGRSRNSLGFLRLLFAALVMLSHSAELIDGNRSRELLTRLFGTLSFGELGVDGFFLISGYLITQSWLRSRTWQDYLAKRVLRIYPGYVLAYLVSLLVGVTVGGGKLSFKELARHILQMALLDPPGTIRGAFAGLHYRDLNGSMWTISYEFQCYLAVMALGALGVLFRRRLHLLLTLVLLGLLMSRVGILPIDIRFGAVFCCGASFYLWRDRIAYTGRGAAAAAAALALLMFVPRLAEPAVATLGGYVLFWFAFHAKADALSRVDNRVDLSYGLYLYAWPVQSALILEFRGITPWQCFAAGLVIAAACGLVSWFLVERPAIRLKRAFAGPESQKVGQATGFT